MEQDRKKNSRILVRCTTKRLRDIRCHSKIPVGVITCFSVNGKCPRPCSTTFNSKFIQLNEITGHEVEKGK
jgi:hypothetical protein